MSKFLKTTSNPRKVQERVLADKLRRNRDSEWGRKWDFKSIKNIETYQERLPLATYETFSPYIEKLKRGDTGALLGPGEKLLGFGITSGTTAQPKFIPYTQRFIREYRRGTSLFAFRVILDNPKLLNAKILSVFSPARDFTTEFGNYWCGSNSGWLAEQQLPFIRSFYAIPNDVFEIDDSFSRYYTLMRLALTKNIGTFITANPSTVLTLIHLVNTHKEDLIRDIFDGSLLVREFVPDRIIHIINDHLGKDPQKARSLLEVSEKVDFLAPQHYWPNLELVGCWKGGTLFPYIRQFPEYFSDSVAIQDLGLLATEGCLSIPVVSGEDSGCLAVDSNFYEFIPEEENQTAPRVYLADELEVGKMYSIVITTSSGFTRYQIGDIVQVTGFVNKTPMIRFLNKGKHFSSLTGEKISEHQVVTAINDVAREYNLHFSYFTMCPCWSDIPYYAFLAEEHELGNRSMWPQFITRLDRRLGEINIEYDQKRASGRLGSIRLKVLERGCFNSLENPEGYPNGRLEQYKHVYLSPSIDYDRNFPVVEIITGLNIP